MGENDNCCIKYGVVPLHILKRRDTIIRGFVQTYHMVAVTTALNMSSPA